MAREDLKAKVRLEGDAKGATAAIKKTESGFKRLGSSIRKFSLAQAAAFGAVVLALRGMVRAFKGAIDAANAQEDAINALDGALADLGPAADKVSKALQRQAAELQAVSKFGDETIIQAQALIASFVKEEDQIKAATKATLDLAEAKGFSLVSAADLISKTLGSSTNALTRYGIEVTGAVGSTERLTSLTENIAKVFGGRAKKATETFSGAMTQLSNVIGDEFSEAIGEGITKNEDLIKTIRTLTEEIPNFTAGVSAIAEAFRESSAANNEFVGGLGQKLASFLDVTLGGYVKLASAISAYGEQTKNINALEERRTELLQQLNRRFNETNESLLVQLGLGGTYIEQVAKIAEVVESAADAQKRLAEESEEAADAMTKLGAALDEVTSSELEAEILKIETNLESVRVATGGIGPEFERLNDIATAEIEDLNSRIEGLVDGLGDVGEALEATKTAADGTGDSFGDLAGDTRTATAALAEQASQARVTTAELLKLTAVGEQLALAEARVALAISQDSRRRRVTSQQTNAGRPAGSTINTGFFTGNTGSYTINPDGSLRPI